MKKAGTILSVVTLFILAQVVSAQSSQQAQQQNLVQDAATYPATVSSQVNQLRAKNQSQVQNQGAGVQLQISTKEQTELNQAIGEGLQNRNQSALQNMSEVARQVQQMLQVRTEGGIGEQVRKIAQEQNQAQTQIQNKLNQLDSKGKFARFLTGTDYGAVKNLKAQMVQNQAGIKQLEQLQVRLTDQIKQKNSA